jgi:hypothetical protein
MQSVCLLAIHIADERLNNCLLTGLVSQTKQTPLSQFVSAARFKVGCCELGMPGISDVRCKVSIQQIDSALSVLNSGANARARGEISA